MYPNEEINELPERDEFMGINDERICCFQWLASTHPATPGSGLKLITELRGLETMVLVLLGARQTGRRA